MRRLRNSHATTTMLVGILLLAFFLRMSGWHTGDAKLPYLFFEPDEHQHLEIAQIQLAQLQPGLYQAEELAKKPFNARGYGQQLGTLLALLPLTDGPPSNAQIIQLGRQLSTVYALLLCLLIFWLGSRLGDPTTGLLAAALLALNDLNITYSHYAVPELSYVSWLYFYCAAVAVYVLRPNTLRLFLLAFAAAGVFTVKFDFLPAFLSLGLIGWAHYRQGYWLVLGRSMSLLLFLLISLYLQHFGELELQTLVYSWQELSAQNQDAIAVDQHWVYNPLLYVLGSVAALGLPTFGCALLGGKRIWNEWSEFRKRPIAPAILTIVLLLALEFGVRWSIDTPFIRRLNFLMPGLCLLAAYQLAAWWRSGKRAAVSLVLVYALGFTLASQINHWQDPRYAARDYLQAQHAGDLISYSGYVQTVGMPKSRQPLAESTYYVMHETLYRRFGKSFTTPFKTPRCCEEVYHCFWEPAYCEFHQRLLANTDPDFVFFKGFYTKEIFPERWLHHALFGHFETFRGDVLMYVRRDAPAG